MTDIHDIVNTLRWRAKNVTRGVSGRLMVDAADEIERLRKELAYLKEINAFHREKREMQRGQR